MTIEFFPTILYAGEAPIRKYDILTYFYISSYSYSTNIS